jgi:tRNA(Ile)-lysidine synthase
VPADRAAARALEPGGDAAGELVPAPARTVAVAVSGGRDSLALLHAAVRAARPLGVRVVALHVHHGLMAEADAWAAGVERACAQLAGEGADVRFACTRLRGAPGAGQSVEAWARRERYAALAAMAWAAGATLVLLAHHRRDQAETVLLQALRGGAAAGLSAMPAFARRRGLAWARPWLACADADIDAYARARGLAPVHDPSNVDPRFARGRLRTRVMPALRDAFPDAEAALAAVARHAQEARAVLAEVADEDLARLGVDAQAGDALPLAPWRALSPARRANVLRAWLARRLARGAPEALVQRLLAEAVPGATRRWPVGGPGERGLLRAWRGRLALVEPQGPPDPAARARLEAVPGRDGHVGLALPGGYRLPGWDGLLEVAPVAERGIDPARLGEVVVRARAGGERFRRHPAAPARPLKKQYQAAGIPEEGRAGPLLFDRAGALLFAPGLGVDASCWAPAGAPQFGLRWHAGAHD